VAVANYAANTVSVLLGNGDGTFGPKSDYGTGIGPGAAAIADLNADGEPDLAVANYTAGTVSVLLGNGDGTLGTKGDYGTGIHPYAVAIGDPNEDGRPDLAVANYGAHTVSVLLHADPSTVAVGRTSAGPSERFRLVDLRPNPSRGTSEIRFLLPSACTVDVAVFDLAGRRVRSLVADERSTPGEHRIRWDGRDGSGSSVRDGVYLLIVRAGRDAGVRKLVVLR